MMWVLFYAEKSENDCTKCIIPELDYIKCARSLIH